MLSIAAIVDSPCLVVADILMLLCCTLCKDIELYLLEFPLYADNL